MARSLAAGLLALAAAAACDRAPAPRPASAHTVVLLGGRVFEGGDRVARLLDDMAAATDVLGACRFVVASAPGARPEELPPLLAQQPDADVAIAVIGDLAVLAGVDPSLEPQDPVHLSSRVVDEHALADSLDRLENDARARGTELLVATAPLGRQAHVEVPELPRVAELLRARGAVLDLGKAFAGLEPEPLFANGIDKLDDFGHDELARALFELFCQDTGPLPPRTPDEAAARREARTLAAYRADRREEFLALAQEVLAEPAFTPRHATRQAAIAAARDGLPASRARWEAIGAPADGAVPGLALGRLLCDTSDTPAAGTPEEDRAAQALAARDTDPLEAELVQILQTLRRGDASARGLAEACVDAHPERLEAWIVLQLVAVTLPPPHDVRPEARENLALFTRSAVAGALVERLLQHWPDPVAALPALLLGARPFAKLQVSGPLLETARMRASIGYVDHALELLQNGMRGRRLPPSWAAESARIAALPRG